MYMPGILLVFGASCLITVHCSLITQEEYEKLKTSPLIPVKKGVLKTPGRNLKEVMVKVKENCKCEGLICNCCTKVGYGFMSINTCLRVGYNTKTKSLDLAATIAGKSLYSKTVHVGDVKDMCFSMGVEDLNACIRPKVARYETGGMKTCLTFDIDFIDVQILNMNFHCFAFTGKELIFEPSAEAVEQDALINVGVRKPLDIMVKLLQKVIDKIKAAM